MAHTIMSRVISGTARPLQFRIRATTAHKIGIAQPSYRSFHASSRRQFNPIDPIIYGTTAALQSIHAVLPWYMVIPIAAVSVRLMLLPMNLWTRRLNAQRVSLFSLLHAWRHALRRGLYRAPTAAKLPPSTLMRTESKLLRKKQAELFKKYGCQSWKNWVPILPQFGAFLVMVETIRGLVGAKEGILRMTFGREATIQAPEVLTSAGDALEKTLVGSASSLIQADPTMATEGMLWFTDLTAADPQLILPFVLSATIFANTLPKHVFSRKPAPPAVEQSLVQRTLGRLMKFFALAIGPLTLSLPSGLLLYWISSSALSLVQALALDVFKPLPRGVKPCAPPKSQLGGQFTTRKTETPMRDNLQARLNAAEKP